MDVYITDVSAFMPNEPVDNDHMEEILGMVHRVPSRTRKIILRNNKIKERYYAIDPVTGEPTHTNAQLAAEAVRRLDPYPGFCLDDIECLSCGTTSPDMLLPGHGLQVHGELGNKPCEVITTAGICLSSLSAFKYAYMNVALGLTKNGVAVGSELSSSFFNAKYCEPAAEKAVNELEKQPSLSFSKDFLRWMLSDGAGAVFLSPDKPETGIGLKVEWIEQYSFANELETCMWGGGIKKDDGRVTGWRALPSLEDAITSGAFLVQQDVKLLNKEIMYTAGERTLPLIMEKRDLKAEDVDWYLPHYSSNYFRQPLYDHMKNAGLEIPFEKWFTNLPYKGNTGAAAPYIILKEFFHSTMPQKGDTVLCFIPESGRFSMGYMLLSVV